MNCEWDWCNHFLFQLPVAVITAIGTWVIVRFLYIPIKNKHRKIARYRGCYRATMVRNSSDVQENIPYYNFYMYVNGTDLNFNGKGRSSETPAREMIVTGFLQVTNNSGSKTFAAAGYYIDKRLKYDGSGEYDIYRGEIHAIAISEDEFAVHAPYINNKFVLVHQDITWKKNENCQ